MYFSTIVSNLNTKITKVDLVDQCLTINNCNFLTLARHDIYIVKQDTRAVSTQIQQSDRSAKHKSLHMKVL